jgi:intein/homing endonuclease
MNLAYVAGLMDGEGSIGFTKSRSAMVPRVSITNTNLDLLQQLKECFGGHIQQLSRGKDNWKKAYAWVINNSKAVDFVSKIEPWLRIKKEQTWLLYAWEEIRPGYNKSWTTEKMEALELINAQSKWLNFRGLGRAEKSPIDVELEGLAK